MNKKNNKLIIFENIPENDFPQSLFSEDTLAVAFSVYGKKSINNKGVNCIYPDELVEIPDLNKIGINNLYRVKNICKFLDIKLQENLSSLKSYNLNIFSASFFTIKVFFDSLYTSYVILRDIFEKTEAYEEITFFKDNYNFEDFVEGKSGIVSAIIEKIFLSKYKSIKFIQNNNIKKCGIFPCIEGIKWYLRDLLSLKFSKRKKIKGIVLANTHDIPFVINRILKDISFYTIIIDNNILCYRLNSLIDFKIKKINNDKDISCNIQEIFKKLCDDQEYRKLFWDDEELFYFVNKCLESYLIKSIGKFLPYISSIRDWVSGLDFKLLVTSYCRLNMKDAFILEIVKSLNIPVITYQEGGGTGYLDWPLFQLDVDLSDYFFVYGEGVMESLYVNKGRAKILPVGSIRLNSIRKSLTIKGNKELKIYLILDNIKLDAYQHYPYNGGLFSQAYKYQLKILEVIKLFPNVTFIIKTIKGRSYLYEEFINDFIKIDTRPLSSILEEGSAFILEYPSTVLQECLLINKPIALFYNSDAVCFENRALELLKKRIRISNDPGEFYKIIEKLIIDVHSGTNMTEENEFLYKYCLMENTEERLKKFFSNLF